MALLLYCISIIFNGVLQPYMGYMGYAYYFSVELTGHAESRFSQYFL